MARRTGTHSGHRPIAETMVAMNAAIHSRHVTLIMTCLLHELSFRYPRMTLLRLDTHFQTRDLDLQLDDLLLQVLYA